MGRSNSCSASKRAAGAEIAAAHGGRSSPGASAANKSNRRRVLTLQRRRISVLFESVFIRRTRVVPRIMRPVLTGRFFIFRLHFSFNVKNKKTYNKISEIFLKIQSFRKDLHYEKRIAKDLFAFRI